MREIGETNAARTDVLIRSTFDWSQKGYDSYALNAVRVAVAVREFQTTDGLHISAEVVRALATAPGLLGNIHQLHNPRCHVGNGGACPAGLWTCGSRRPR